MFEKCRQFPVGAWHSARKLSYSPKNGCPNAAPLHPDVTSTTFQTSSKHQWLSRIIRGSFGVLFISSLILFIVIGQIQSSASSQEPSSNTAQLVQQGVDRYQAGDYTEAITLWQTALDQYQQNHQLAHVVIVQENLARAYQKIGQSNRAIAQWDTVIGFYRQTHDQSRIGRALTEQAQVYSSIGQPRQAIALLCGTVSQELSQELSHCAAGSAIEITQAANDANATLAALGSLGEAYRLIGEYDAAIALLQSALERDRSIAASPYRVALLNSLGNAYGNRAQISYRREALATERGATQAAEDLHQRGGVDDQWALTELEKSAEIARTESDLEGQVRSLLNTIPIYQRTKATQRAVTALQQVQTILNDLPESQMRVYATIGLVRLLPIQNGGDVAEGYQCHPGSETTAKAWLTDAVAIAQRIQDQRAESFALGELGHLYECQGETGQALDLTRQARWAADQSLAGKDSLYLWEWQTGRILSAQGDLAGAIAAYDRAINTLETIRGDILTAARDTQFDFRDIVEPIYRGAIALRFSQEQSNQEQSNQEQPAATSSQSLNPANRQGNLKSILRTIDSLKLAELQNYFGNDCVVIAPQQSGLDAEIDQTTAVINTLILDDKTVVILSLPSGEERFSWIDSPQSVVRYQINEFRQELESYTRLDYNPKSAQQLYDWLIRPFAINLEQAQIKTLVFVQDGIFRSVPMAALQDGDRFLVEQYAIAITPSLTLTAARVVPRNDLRLLALGFDQAATIDEQVFPPLPNVQRELNGITAIVPNSRELLNQNFTRDRLQQELSQTIYPIIHIATHGKFSTDPSDAFIVTGDGQKLTFQELDRLIRKVTRNPDPLELLALTACETAAGDDRAALGLAGVAVQAGAKSALASLWKIDDASTATIATNFYTNLRQSATGRADALRMAQIKQFRGTTSAFVHPGLWSALVLVGNWR
jgi:CHAT domain-containing protein